MVCLLEHDGDRVANLPIPSASFRGVSGEIGQEGRVAGAAIFRLDSRVFRSIRFLLDMRIVALLAMITAISTASAQRGNPVVEYEGQGVDQMIAAFMKE